MLNSIEICDFDFLWHFNVGWIAYNVPWPIDTNISALCAQTRLDGALLDALLLHGVILEFNANPQVIRRNWCMLDNSLHWHRLSLKYTLSGSEEEGKNAILAILFKAHPHANPSWSEPETLGVIVSHYNFWRLPHHNFKSRCVTETLARLLKNQTYHGLDWLGYKKRRCCKGIQHDPWQRQAVSERHPHHHPANRIKLHVK